MSQEDPVNEKLQPKSRKEAAELDIGARLRSVRERAGLSQRELAKKAGVTHSTISLIEQEAHAPSLAALRPDFAGFRSAVCAGDRSGALERQRLHDLVGAMRLAQASVVRTSPSSSERMRASSAR